MKCRFCDTPLQDVFLDLGSAPPSNAFLRAKDLNAAESWFPLRLYTCAHCHLVQVDEVQKHDALFSGDYVYFSSYSRSWLAHAERYVAHAAERLGLGPQACQGWNPRLVYGRMTGWGQEGPRALQAGHDLNYVALSGALWYASLPGQPPLTPPTLLGDIGGGALYLVAGMLAGLIRAGRTGLGTVVDAAIVDGSAHMMTLVMLMQSGGMFRAERGQSLLDGPHWSRSYACADGGFVTVQCLEPRFYAEFLSLLSLSTDSDFARQNDPATWPRATGRLAAIFAGQSRDHWTALFAGSDACVAPVLTPAEAAADPHLAARSTWTRAGGALQARPAPRFDGRALDPAEAPLRDQHRAEILRLLGLA